jgi:putative FmdB family regulatory protein
VAEKFLCTGAGGQLDAFAARSLPSTFGCWGSFLTMPLYEYRCNKCETVFERIQKFSDPPEADCPECSGTSERLLSAPAIQFKGSGWYVTDYAGKGSGGSDGSGKSDGDTKAKDTAKTETKKKNDTGTVPAKDTTSSKK